jgi:hypothetical protein
MAQQLRAPTGREGCGGVDYISKCLGIHDVSKTMLDPKRIGGAATCVERGIGKSDCGGNSVCNN